MKSRIIIIAATAALCASPAQAAWTDTAPVVAAASAWTQVKQKVTEWVGYYWNGTGTTAPVAEQQSAAVRRPAQAQPVTPATPGTAAQSAPLNEAAKQLVAQPLYTQKPQNNSTLQDVQSAKEKVKSAQLLKVEPGRAGTTVLPKSKVGVPLVNFAQLKKIKKIPRLDIGTEGLVSQEQFTVNNLHWEVVQPADFKKLPQPTPVAESEIRPFTQPVAKAPGPKGLQANMRTAGHPVTMEQVQKVAYTLKELAEFSERPYKSLNEDQLKMLASLILYSKGKHCHAVMGLFHQLAQKPTTKLEATYHLGACAAELKMHQAAFDNLSKVVASEDKDYAKSALTILAQTLQPVYEKDFFHLVKNLKNQKEWIAPEAQDAVAYRAGKGAYRAGEFKTSLVFAEQVSTKSEFHNDARFLEAMDHFAAGDKATALKTLQDLWTAIAQGSDTNLKAVTSVNLARMYFAQKKYGKALEHYMQVPKDHPLWVQALIEQGWTQLANDDYAGAIGNMYSLHSPYFKAVYQPESFVVRTIGYLNICQYGDAYKSLSWLEKDYREWYGKTSNYLQNKSTGPDVYASVKSYIRGKSTNDVDGVPFQIWREVAHRKDFLNVQSALNEDIDEAKRYPAVNGKMNDEKASIVWHEDQTKKRFDGLRANIAKAKTDPLLMKKLEEMKASMKLEHDYTIGYRYQLTLLDQNRQGYAGFEQEAESRLDHQNSVLTERAGELLLGHTKQMKSEMARDLENNEFLRYEVFSGSGENIRYQVAGGQVAGANRIPANIKPTKMMNWNFDGEFWEDEIGSYRSGLQNNCPKSKMAKAAAAASSATQARHTEDDENP